MPLRSALKLTAGIAAAACAWAWARGADREVVDFVLVEGRARELAQRPYDDNWGMVPDFLRELSYKDYQKIQFHHLKALWRDTGVPFSIEFFHPGGTIGRAVRIHEFSDTHTQEIRFSSELFEYGDKEVIRQRIPPSLGYAGFRVLSPLHKRDIFEEFATFAGASYFRLRSRGSRYGVSARGLAVNTVSPQPEEFPAFREFWLGKPRPDADALIIYALLDGPSVAGAYAFRLQALPETRLEVQATLFCRREVAQIGVAPFSSMFLFGENCRQRQPTDYRPEVHDSDGLLIVAPDGTRLWRPLVNPIMRRVSFLDYERPVLYGLLQRDRDFASYQDINAAYQERASAWVEPGRWSPGRVVLYEFASHSEGVDNVTAFWEPSVRPRVGEPYSFSYAVRFFGSEAADLGFVTATRAGVSLQHSDLVELVIDFDGGPLENLDPLAAVKPSVSCDPAIAVEHAIVMHNPHAGTWRLIIQFRQPRTPIQADLRAFLELKGQRLTETWSYAWTQ